MKSVVISTLIIIAFGCELENPNEGSGLSVIASQEATSTETATAVDNRITPPEKSNFAPAQDLTPLSPIDTTEVSQHLAALIAMYTAKADRYQSLHVVHTDDDYRGVSTWLFDDSCSLIYMHETGADSNYRNSSHYFFEFMIQYSLDCGSGQSPPRVEAFCK